MFDPLNASPAAALGAALAAALRSTYGTRLKAAAVFGPAARGASAAEIDLLLVVDPLPGSWSARRDEFDAVTRFLAPAFERARLAGLRTWLAPVIQTPDELRRGAFLHRDLADPVDLLVDDDGLLAAWLGEVAARLAPLPVARRVESETGAMWEVVAEGRPLQPRWSTTGRPSPAIGTAAVPGGTGEVPPPAFGSIAFRPPWPGRADRLEP